MESILVRILLQMLYASTPWTTRSNRLTCSGCPRARRSASLQWAWSASSTVSFLRLIINWNIWEKWQVPTLFGSRFNFKKIGRHGGWVYMWDQIMIPAKYARSVKIVEEDTKQEVDYDSVDDCWNWEKLITQWWHHTSPSRPSLGPAPKWAQYSI